MGLSDIFSKRSPKYRKPTSKSALEAAMCEHGWTYRMFENSMYSLPFYSKKWGEMTLEQKIVFIEFIKKNTPQMIRNRHEKEKEEIKR